MKLALVYDCILVVFSTLLTPVAALAVTMLAPFHARDEKCIWRVLAFE